LRKVEHYITALFLPTPVSPFLSAESVQSSSSLWAPKARNRIAICERKWLDFGDQQGLLLNLQKVNILICAICTTHRLISADIRRCFCAKGAELCPWVCQKPELGVEYKRCKNRGGLRPDGIIPLTDAKLGCICQYFQKGGR
jgi:hypothetical protein